MKFPAARSWLPQPRPISPVLSTWLDFFRWTAAFAVFLAHARAGVLVDYHEGMKPLLLARAVYWLPGFAHSAVMVFFVLSGYLVGGEILRSLQRGNFDWRVYVSRRVARLYAGFVIALLLGGLWDWVGLHHFNSLEFYTAQREIFTMVFYPIDERLNLATFTGNLALCQTILVPCFGSNAALWSLANEAWYYALVPLTLWPLFSRGPAPARLLAIGLGVAAIWFVRGEILLYLSIWLIGLIPHALPRTLFRSPWPPVAAFLVMLSVGRLHLFLELTQWGLDLLVALTFALVLNALEFQARPAPGPAAWHRAMAGFSYTVYLAHWPLTLLLIAICHQEFGFGYHMPFSFAGVGVLALFTLVLYAYFWLLSHATERPTPRIRDWLLARAGANVERKGS